MATAVVGKALSYVGDKLLAYFAGNVLKDWAATVELGDNVEALEMELLSVKALLHPITAGKEIVDKDNLALKQLLEMLQDLGYDADDVLDEMDYFRIQDTLDGTFHATDQHAQGWAHNLAQNVHHTATATAGKLICLPASRACCDTIIHAVGKCFPCSPLPLLRDDDEENSDNSMQQNSPERYHTDEPPNLEFDRVGASNKMRHIVEEMRKLRQSISSIIITLGSNSWTTVPNIAQSHRISFSESIEPRLYGRELKMNSIIDDIINGKYSSEVLTVIPIVGPGGIGKTTLAQHIYHSEKLQQHFKVKVWTCVSLNFDVHKLIKEIVYHIPKVADESSNSTDSELIGQRLIKGRKLFLVLDDIWDCSNEDQWKQLLLPFKKSQERGNIILATTRLPKQAQIMTQKPVDPIHLQGLETEEFKKLFLYIVFGDDDQSRRDHEFLFNIGFKIAGRLNGSPLAAKTVGRLLKTQLDLNHWTRVLESKEWEQTDDKNDIMPALKLSFDYLPSHQLKQCLSYCALFPQDYKFKEQDLINFLIGQEVVHSSCGENKTVEDIERTHLTKLVDYGFLERKQEEDGSICYNIHDLLHELVRKVSSHECLIIDSSQSQVRSLQVLPSIRHLSINIEDTSVKDRLTRTNCVEDFSILFTRLKVEKLRTLMLFGEHHGFLVKAFGDLFRKAKALRVIFLSKASYDVQDLLCNFYCLLHLRYLRIESSSIYKARFPNKISRFYHMMVLDAKHCDIIDLPRDINNLVKLRHLLVQNDRQHSSIVDVGKLKSLQELRMFMVKQEDQGFELRQIGHLIDLCGLSIYNLQNVEVKEEADEAQLLSKSHLHELRLHWDNIDRSTDDSTVEEHVLERLKPSSNLQMLSIIGHRGGTCPSWLGMDLSLVNLQSFCLVGVTWEKFPPIGELCLVNNGEICSGNIPEKRFENLRRLELRKLTMVKKWVVHAICQLFPFLEVLIIKDWPQLVELSFQHIACCQQGEEANIDLFPRLSELKIDKCPKLLSFPRVPWTKAPCSSWIYETGSFVGLSCTRHNLEVYGKNDTADIPFWNALDFHNLTGLTHLRTLRCLSLPLRYLKMLSSLRTLQMSCPSNAFPFVEADSHVKYQFPLESLTITKWCASGKELTRLLTYFPKLSHLALSHCEKITGLGVRGLLATETPGPSSSASEVDIGAVEEIVALEEEEECLLLLPPQLQELRIGYCQDLSLHFRSNEDAQTGRGGLLGLSSLREFKIWDCPKLLSAYSSSSFSSFPFPNSLEYLSITLSYRNTYISQWNNTVVPLSNLTSLTRLDICNCGDSRGYRLLSLLTHGHLTKLSVKGTPNFFVDSETSQVHGQDLRTCSSKLQELEIDDVVGFSFTAFRHNLHLSSLTTLKLENDYVERFTEEQEALLFVNSLEKINFVSSRRLKSLPARLRRLPNLKTLRISDCDSIQILPEDGLPSSLQELKIDDCQQIRSLPKDCLPSSLQKLVIVNCRAIRSLPEVDDLPCSLQELDVRFSRSEELRRQCRTLIGVIPIVHA